MSRYNLHIIQAISLCRSLSVSCHCVKDKSIIWKTVLGKLVGLKISDGVVVKGVTLTRLKRHKRFGLFNLWILAGKKREALASEGMYRRAAAKTKCSSQRRRHIFQLTTWRHSFLKQVHKWCQDFSYIHYRAGSSLTQTAPCVGWRQKLWSCVSNWISKVNKSSAANLWSAHIDIQYIEKQYHWLNTWNEFTYWNAYQQLFVLLVILQNISQRIPCFLLFTHIHLYTYTRTYEQCVLQYVKLEPKLMIIFIICQTLSWLIDQLFDLYNVK